MFFIVELFKWLIEFVIAFGELCEPSSEVMFLMFLEEAPMVVERWEACLNYESSTLCDLRSRILLVNMLFCGIILDLKSHSVLDS